MLQAKISKLVLFHQLCEQLVARHGLKACFKRCKVFGNFANAGLDSCKTAEQRKTPDDSDHHCSSHQDVWRSHS